MLASCERNNANSIPTNAVAPLVICTPYFDEELGPPSDSFCLIMNVKGVVPLCHLFGFVLYFFVGLALVFAADDYPVVAGPNTKLTKDSIPIKPLSTFYFSN